MTATIVLFSLTGYLWADFLITREIHKTGKSGLMYPALKLISGLVTAGVIVGIVTQLHLK
jgi:hypothetical protein